MERELHVCHLGKFYPPAPGGIETHVRGLAHAQRRLGAKVSVLCVNHQDSQGRDVTDEPWARTLGAREDDGGVQVQRLGRRASLARWDLCPQLVGALRTAWQERPDVVHVHVPNPTMLLALAAFPPPAPLVISHHSDVIRQRVLKHLLRPAELLVYARAARVIADSAGYVEGSPLLRQFRAKVREVPLGIDLAPYLNPSAGARAYAASLRQELGAPLWLSVGRLVYYKGLDVAIQALRQLRGRLVIVGTGPQRRGLEELAREQGVADRVVFRGHLAEEELAGAYQAATALLFPSTARSEAFGLVQVEAMASGCPVVNTDVPCSGVAWVSRHLESGLTVPVGDAPALAAAAARLTEEPSLRTRLSEGARARAMACFDENVMGRRTLEVYGEALAAQAVADGRPGWVGP